MSRKQRLMLSACGAFALLLNAVHAAEPQPTVVSGRELFERQWLPNDPRSHGGDGLGPVYNDTSCVACHNQGGPGGGGAASQNVDIVSVFLNEHQFRQADNGPSVLGALTRSLLGLPAQAPAEDPEKRRERQMRALEAGLKQVHPGFLEAQSLVVHKQGADAHYEQWRQQLIGMDHGFHSFGPMHAIAAEETIAVVPTDEPRVVRAISPQAEEARQQMLAMAQNRRFTSGQVRSRDRFLLTTTQRNATALFGAGRLDSVSDDVLRAQAQKKFEDFPEISGRVCRLKDGKLGRFGWKAQTPSLEDFALTACAVELGLNVPGHTQAGLAYDADYRAPGLDMNREECDALVDYLRRLPDPQQQVPQHPQAAAILHEGEQLFAKVGCAHCHTPNLGEVSAVYSDLLLHDMGESLQDSGDYGVFVPDSPGGDQEPVVEQLVRQIEAGNSFRNPLKPESDEDVLGARRNEWRTPPLWGVRDSAPYLHDGRAQTLDEAIAFHDGEARRSAGAYFELKPTERRKLIAFLQSLAAPSQVAASE